MICVTDAIHQLTLQTTRSIQFTASAIIDLNTKDLEDAYFSFSIGLLQATALVSLGILGLIEPELSLTISHESCFKYSRRTIKFCRPTIGKILCTVNAITFFPCNIILGINTLFASPFKNGIDSGLNEASIYLLKAIVDLVAIPGGFYCEQLRQSECIQITNK